MTLSTRNAGLLDSRDPYPHEEIIGSILSRPYLYQEVKNKLTAEHFYELSWLYQIIQQVDEEEGLTFRGVGRRLKTEQLPILQELQKTYISDNRLPILIKQARERKLSDRLKQIGRRLYMEATPEKADDILTKLQKHAFELEGSEAGEIEDMRKIVDEFAAWVEEIMQDPSKAYGLLTGIKEMDAITTGWHRGDLIVVGARTSMGKSAFMIENVLRLHKAGYKVAIFSLEMTRRQIYLRMMANLMGISHEVLRTGQMAAELLPKFHEMKKLLYGIYVNDTRGVDCEYITDIMRRLKRTQGLDFVVVDYLQDVKEKGEVNDNQGSALARVCRKLRTAAQELDVPVMALSQVARAVEDRQDKRPLNSDLSGSTGIETSADVIALLYRDEYYNPTPENEGILEVNFTKQRNGKLGKVELYYDKVRQRIGPKQLKNLRPV